MYDLMVTDLMDNNNSILQRTAYLSIICIKNIVKPFMNARGNE